MPSPCPRCERTDMAMKHISKLTKEELIHLVEISETAEASYERELRELKERNADLCRALSESASALGLVARVARDQ